MHISISKYDPKDRTPDGIYVGTDWETIDDFARRPDFSIEKYLEMEDRHWLILKSVLEYLNIQETKVIAVLPPPDIDSIRDDYKRGPHWDFILNTISLFYDLDPKVGEAISISTIETLVRGGLRDAYWVAMDFESNGYIRTGDYMYLVCGCDQDFQWTDQCGIFVYVSDTPSPWAQSGRGLVE